MGIIELLLIAIGLSMDAFAVSICKGLATSNIRPKHMLLCGIWFGGFQALMPFIGWLLGSTFEKYITNFDHWIAFVLLVLIGGNMIKESFGNDTSETDASFAIRNMFLMAVATSIDALAIGVTFALLPNVNILSAISLIGATTFLLSAAGVKIGSVFGAKYQSKAELAGGIILILIGLKILTEHLGLLP